MRRKIWFSLCCLLLLSLIYVDISAAGEQDMMDELLEQQVRAIDTGEIDKFMAELQAEYEGLLPDFSLRAVLQSFKKDEGFSLARICKNLLGFLFRELATQSTLLLRLLVLALLSVLLEHLHEALDGKVADIAYLICYLVVMGFALQSFARAFELTRTALSTMLAFVHALFPLILTTIMAAGSVSSAALFNPLLVIVLTAINTLIINVAVPLIFFYGILTLANNLSQNIKISRLANILRDVGMGIMGVLFMVFVGFNIAQATVGAVADGAAFRAGKFAIKTFLPIVGSMLSDSFETIAGCTALLGNTLSFVGMMGIFFYCALPAIRIITLLGIYRLAAAVVQPLGGGQLATALGEISSVFTYFFAVLAVVGTMLFVLITVIVGTGNSALMLR